jgi:DNA modification methylase
MTMDEIICGDSLEVLKTFEDGCVQMCVTSPAYWGLRDYGVDGQLGAESTPEEYVDNLVAVFHEVKRILKNDGTLWLNLGDTYAGSGGAGGDYSPGGLREGQPTWKNTYKPRSARQVPDGKNPNAGVPEFGANRQPLLGLKPKDLVGIPWMVAFALRADGWWLRSDIIWHKPNPMPESVTDRPTKSHEYIFLLSKSAQYYYDADAIKEAGTGTEYDKTRRPQNRMAEARYLKEGKGQLAVGANLGNGSETRNKRDVWTVTTKSYTGAHFATFPPDLIEPCILAGSRPGDIVLDPFNGSGTTGAVSIKHNRDYVGIELNPAYIELTGHRFSTVQPVLMQSY